MRFFLTLLTALVLVGCATGPVTLPVDNLATSAKTPVQDLRPQSESTREIFSLIITNDRYGYNRLAEDIITPTGPRLFAHHLQEQYGSQPVPPTKLHHFAVYLNNRAALKRVALGSMFGAIGAVVANGTIKHEGDIAHTLVDADSFAALSGEDEYKRALYSDSELKEGTSAFVIFIESESEGKRRFTRTVSPIKAVESGQKIPLHQALDAAITFHLKS